MGSTSIDQAYNLSDALRMLESRTYRLLIVDVSLDRSLGDPDNLGFKVLDYIKEHRLDTKLIFMTAHGDRFPMDRVVKEEPKVLDWFNKNSSEWPENSVALIAATIRQGA